MHDIDTFLLTTAEHLSKIRAIHEESEGTDKVLTGAFLRIYEQVRNHLIAEQEVDNCLEILNHSLQEE